MRQKDDKLFFDLLNRIRIGSPSEDDIKKLESRIIGIENKSNKIIEAASFYLKNLKEHSQMVCLLPKLEQTDLFNEEVTKLLKIETTKIYAKDSHKKGKSLTKRLTKKKNK